MEAASELWYVQLSDGDVHRVTLDQLDEGFQAGHIDGNTMVLPAGATQWGKLGEIAGIDDVVQAQPPPPPEPQPVAVRAVPLIEFAPPPPLIESHRPVSVDLGDLEFVPGLPRRSRKGWVLGLIGVAMLGALAGVAVERPSILKTYAIHARTRVMATKSWLSGASAPKRSNENSAPPPAAAPAPTVEAAMLATPTTAAPPTEPGAPPVAAPETPAPEPTVTETKAGARSKHHPRKAHPKVAGSAPEPPPKASSFTAKGSKFDPLSSSIQ